MSNPTYPGGELELFAKATHWKKYWTARLRPYLRGAILEVGAGIGSNTLLLANGRQERWVCLEPDPNLVAKLIRRLKDGAHSQGCEVRSGTLEALAPDERFDTILYIDVLEHIADDLGELQRVARHLTVHGRLVVLSPAHSWLFSPFDRAIGHHRRYTRRTLRQLTPTGLTVETSFYLDAVGLLASIANRVLLRQSLPTPGQLAFWDNCLVPCSRILDPLTAHQLGKTVVCVWQRKD